MAEFDKARLDRFLQKSSLIAILATIEARGRPYLVPIWYEWDGRYCWIVSKPRADYVKNLRRDPRASLCVATQTLPYQRVLLQGRVRLIETDQDWLPMGIRMAERYLGKAEGRAYIEKTRNWKRLFLRLTPDRIRSWDGGASGHAWGGRYIEKTAAAPRAAGPSRPTRSKARPPGGAAGTRRK